MRRRRCWEIQGLDAFRRAAVTRQGGVHVMQSLKTTCGVMSASSKRRYLAKPSRRVAAKHHSMVSAFPPFMVFETVYTTLDTKLGEEVDPSFASMLQLYFFAALLYLHKRILQSPLSPRAFSLKSFICVLLLSQALEPSS